ncbi:hypothetical protein GBAR_LOCUS17213 [Geodia barretti]|uniref:Uncharacterized protein n=1 Tax=Geodia barretti TaxID=519541 RepID=A0AA35SKL8_GEOBA|nr:hypothetical protein GBAR_LOCUS17213 [Geodia barretti]
MEPKFRFVLSTCGITDTSITVLEDVNVSSMTVFVSLREEHFEKLLPRLTVGDHAVLLKLWDSKQGVERSGDSSPM